MNHEENFQEIKHFLEKRLEKAGAEKYVLGLSGGMDSSTAAKTVVEALGPEKLVCWSMPAEPTKEENISDARELAESLGVEFREVSIEKVTDCFESDAPFELDREVRGNVLARARMIYTYMEANKNNCLVLGANNRSEVKLGYFTKYGDGATDVAPFKDLYKTELKGFAEYIGLESKFIDKKPTAELWEGQTDEKELGATYEVIDKILKALIEEGMTVEEAADETGYGKEKIERFQKMVENSEHKRKRPFSPDLR